VRSPKQQAAVEKRAAKEQLEAAEKARAVQLAQIVNLHIAGMSLADIGAAIGASADEVDRMLNADVQRYVRSQPALRVYVRNWISERYTKMIDADWSAATDEDHKEKLENQDRVMRMLDKMGRLHGADAPTQTEVKIEAAPEQVEKLVSALSAASGHGYDVSVFDIVDAEIVHDAVGESHAALERAAHDVEESDGDDEL
jgi:hypothetical protein